MSTIWGEFRENSADLTAWVPADHASPQRAAEAESARETTMNDLHGQESDSVDGRIEVGQKASKIKEGQGDKDRKEKARRFYERLLDQLQRIDEEIAFWEERRKELEDQIDALETLQSRLQRGEGADLDEQGRLKNKDAERAIREYEKKRGVKIDRENLEPALIQVILDAAKEERSAIDDKLDSLKTLRDRTINAIDALEQTESIPDPAERAHAQRGIVENVEIVERAKIVAEVTDRGTRREAARATAETEADRQLSSSFASMSFSNEGNDNAPYGSGDPYADEFQSQLAGGFNEHAAGSAADAPTGAEFDNQVAKEETVPVSSPSDTPPTLA